ncbi:disease resistance protein RUN1-like [Rutidosis leptorrhynchoides]|uniref:disease resistance protein RUN1-like n=1 Tax=Rutidosis leptorrhynchoides TaxID=125765 RepID=UPI003A98ED45
MDLIQITEYISVTTYFSNYFFSSHFRNMVILRDILEQSSSSNNHDDSSSSNNHDDDKYDVFLSFRGVDTRFSFTNHLHQALEGANLKTFLDKEEIPRGHYLKPELENAIKSSLASVIVLSENYASSTWCLEELVLILDRHKNFKQIVIPIFYHVEPTDVRKQQNRFRDAMAAHRQKMEAEADVEKKSVLAEKIEIWKEALTQVSNLTGFDVKGRLETELIKEIILNLSKSIRVPIRTTLPLLTGKDEAIKFITLWLKDGSSHTVDILSIYGMGGIGMTSLARYVYESYCREFDRSSIIEDISRKCVGQINGLLDLQKQLHNVSIASNKVLIVLDDIDSVHQLDALLGFKDFHPGSKIIITTRDISLTERSVLLKNKVEYIHTKYLLREGYNDLIVKVFEDGSMMLMDRLRALTLQLKGWIRDRKRHDENKKLTSRKRFCECFGSGGSSFGQLKLEG